MAVLNKEAKEVIKRIEKCAENYGKVFDYDKVMVAMNKHYRALGIPIPKAVVIENMEEAYKVYSDAAWDAARDAAWDAAWGAAWGAAWDAAWGAAWGAAWDAARDAAWGAARDAAWDAARDAAWDAAWGAAWGAAAINTGLTDTKTLKFIEIELPLLEALESGLGFFFPMKDQLILIPVPTFRLDTSNFLHSDTNKAIEWKDGTGYNYLHGVKFPSDLWAKVVSKEMPFQDILAIVDTDQRTQAMKYGNVRDFLKHTNSKLLDTYEKLDINADKIKYELWEIPKGNIFSKNVHYCLYNCPSTGKEYMSGVPEFTKVADAMAWKSSMPVRSWKKLIPLLDES